MVGLKLSSEQGCVFQVRTLPSLNSEEACVQSLFACLALVLLFVLLYKVYKKQRGNNPGVDKLLIQIAAYFVVFSLHCGLSLVYYLVENPTSVLTVTFCSRIVETLRLMEIGCQSQIFLSIADFYDNKMQSKLPTSPLFHRVNTVLQVLNLFAVLGTLAAILVLNFMADNQSETVHQRLYYIYSSSNVLFSFIVIGNISYIVLNSFELLLRHYKKEVLERVKHTLEVLVFSSASRVVYKVIELTGAAERLRPLDKQCRSTSKDFAVVQFFVSLICCILPQMVMLAVVEDCNEIAELDERREQAESFLSEADRLSTAATDNVG